MAALLTVRCAIFTESGAALDVVSPIAIPERFTLIVPPDGLQKRCQVMWRQEKRIGVAFLP